jgi:hypothetical protein
MSTEQPHEHEVSSLIPYFQDGIYHSSLLPVERLWAEVLIDALEEVAMISREPQRKISWKMWNEARRWIMSKDTEWVGSFNRIVQAIHHDPDVIRKKILEFRCECCGVLVMEEPCQRIVKPRRTRRANSLSRCERSWELKKG